MFILRRNLVAVVTALPAGWDLDAAKRDAAEKVLVKAWHATCEICGKEFVQTDGLFNLRWLILQDAFMNALSHHETSHEENHVALLVDPPSHDRR